MVASDTAEIYRIMIDGEWTLEDLGEYPRLFEQVYLGIHAFNSEIRTSPIRTFGGLEGIAEGGGYATVNLYRHLAQIAPQQRRIRVNAIRYSSPGFIEIIADLGTVQQVAVAVASISASLAASHRVYMMIRRGAFEIRKRQREERRELFDLRAEELKYLSDSALKLEALMKIDGFRQIEELTGDPDATLQLYLGLYRRAERLAAYDEEGKAKLPLR